MFVNFLLFILGFIAGVATLFYVLNLMQNERERDGHE